MVYTILITVVFIAEIIIAVTIFQNLIKLDKTLLEWNETLIKAKGSITDIAVLGKNISEQFVEFAENFVEKVKEKNEDILLRQLSKILIGILLIKINSKAINKFRKTGIAKALNRGLSLLETMV